MAKATSAALAYWAAQDVIYLTPEQAAEIIGCDANVIRVAASTPEGRDALGFKVLRLGNTTKIPRIPLLRTLGWEGEILGAIA